MTHTSRTDWCVLTAIAVTIAAIIAGASYWLDGPVLLVLMLWAYPQSYETTAEGLRIRDALTRRLIPYSAITGVAPAPRGRVRIQHGRAAEVVIAPSDRRSFFADLARHTPHLVRRSEALVLSDRHVEYRFVRYTQNDEVTPWQK